VAEQLSNAVPIGGAVLAVSAEGIVRLDGSGERSLGQPAGSLYSLHPSIDGGVDFLVHASTELAYAMHWNPDRGFSATASGPLTRLHLFNGRGGLNNVVGATHVTAGARLRVVPAVAADVIGGSLDGAAQLAAPPASSGQEDPELRSTSNLQVLASSLPNRNARHVSSRVPGDLRSPEVSTIRARGGFASLALHQPQAATMSAYPPLTFTTLNDADSVADSGVPPGCSVPRNNLGVQAPQPFSDQVDWALQLAARGALGSAGSPLRPDHYLTMGLGPYSPSVDFPPGSLLQWGTNTQNIPASVMEGLAAQESAWRQMSFHAAPGVGGNPLVANYYGEISIGSLTSIDYTKSDCGYGLGQITDPMRASSMQYTLDQKTKVAVDYAENAAATAQFLVNDWNQLRNLNLKFNNGDPAFLENWYFTFWAYNTGIKTDASGSGLGWTNNPRNTNWDPSRTPFLRTSYADAAQPWRWPYQERVMGWMETPLKNYNGDDSYLGTSNIRIPGINAFCTAADNCSPTAIVGDPSLCDYSQPNGCSNTSFCLDQSSARRCWWKDPYSQSGVGCPNECTASSFTVPIGSPEPPGYDRWPSQCSDNLATNAIIVDDIPNPNRNVKCGTVNYTSDGTFQLAMGRSQSNGDLLSLIDFHQLGAGFGGHMYFTNNRTSTTDEAHTVTATWTPSGLSTRWYNIKAHIPSTGATTQSASYNIYSSGSDTNPSVVVVDQHIHQNRWISLGNFSLAPGAHVTLSNITSEPGQDADVAFDAVAFTPVAGGGTQISKTVTAVQAFDPYQDLFTDPAAWGPGQSSPLKTMKSAYDWGNATTSAVTSFPKCGATLSSSCVGKATWNAYNAWQSDVLAAGTGTGADGASPTTGWTNETLPITEAGWLNFSNPRLGPTMPTNLVSQQDLYKTFNKVKVSYLVKPNGDIDEDSITVAPTYRIGDTHMPTFILAIMNAYNADYGIALPNLTYTADDLNTWGHESTTVNPVTNGGVLPGAAYPDRWKVANVGASCVRVKSMDGGAIGYRPMTTATGPVESVASWVTRVQNKANAGVLPQSLVAGAQELQRVFFSRLGITDWDQSLFYVAPGIWSELDVKVCTDGTVIPGNGSTMAYSSYMPDLYIWVGSQLVNNTGGNKTCTAGSRTCSMRKGDFFNFAHGPLISPPFTDNNPWEFCDVNHRDSRAGNPWDLSWNPLTADHAAAYVSLCDEPTVIQVGDP
jgi:hypothetical protein